MATSSLKPDNSPPPKPSAIDGVSLSKKMELDTADVAAFETYFGEPFNLGAPAIESEAVQGLAL